MKPPIWMVYTNSKRIRLGKNSLPHSERRFLSDVGIVVPVKPDTASDSTILAALETRNLSARKAEADAVSGRVVSALNAAAALVGTSGKAHQC